MSEYVYVCVCVCVCVCVYVCVCVCVIFSEYRVPVCGTGSCAVTPHVAPLVDLFTCHDSTVYHLSRPQLILGSSGAQRPRVCACDQYMTP